MPANVLSGSDPDSAGQTKGSPSPLWQRIQASGVKTLAVMGMTKNTGKTVALNHLLAQAAAAQVAVGMTSIGRDGEDRDAVFFVPKPPVRVWPGNLVATARSTLARAKVRTKLIDATGLDSPMGEIVLVKVLGQGEMEVAGASRSSDQQRVIARLQQCGAALVLLDGALGRSHHASPAIADGVILATGAAIGGGMGDVLRKTLDRLALLTLQPADEATRVLCQAVFDSGGVALWSAQGECLMHARISTLNSAAALMQQAQADIQTIAVSGAVGRALWQVLMTLAASHPGLTLVVQDGTRLFVEAADLAAFARLGARVLAYRGIHILGLTLNPFSPLGGSLDAHEFLAAAQQALPGYAVADVLLEHPPSIGPKPYQPGQPEKMDPVLLPPPLGEGRGGGWTANGIPHKASPHPNLPPEGEGAKHSQRPNSSHDLQRLDLSVLEHAQTRAEWGSDPNSDNASKARQQCRTELGSDPHSAGQADHAS